MAGVVGLRCANPTYPTRPRIEVRGRPKASSPLLIVGLRFANPTYPQPTYGNSDRHIGLSLH